MTSIERHRRRYVRRVIARNEKKKAFLEEHGRFELCSSRNAIGRSAEEASHGSAHKESTKKYMLYRLKNDAITSDKMNDGRNICGGFICFKVNERGKTRKIMSVHFKERVAQKSLNKNILIPCMMRSNIYDNGASQKEKGGAFFHSELTKHLIRHYKKYGSEGYALILDYHDFFGSADHKVIKRNIFDAMKILDMVKLRWMCFDIRVVKLAYQFIDAYKRHKMRKEHIDEESAAFGVGLGSEVNQTVMVTYPNKIDHYIKEILQIKNFDRYMDDSILIHHSLSCLKLCFEMIKEKCKELGITLNEKKSQIVKLTHGFTICKVKYNYGRNGAVIRRATRKKFSRERVKLKKQYVMFIEGKLSFEDVFCSYASWRGSLIQNKDKRNRKPHTFHNTSMMCHRSLRKMDMAFNDMFVSQRRSA